MTTAETRTVTTMRADQLQPGDVVKLVGTCTVVEVMRPATSRCTVIVDPKNRAGDPSAVVAVWLWKYSRVEVFSGVGGRGHLVTPMHAEPESEQP